MASHGKGHRVAGGRIDRVDGGHPGRAVVGVVDAAVAVEDDLRVGGEHGVRSERPDLADEVLAEGEVVVECAVGLVEERHARVADDVGGDPLLLFAQRRERHRIEVGVLAAGIATRAADEPADRALVDPARGRCGGAEVGVVGVGDDEHESRRPPVVRDVSLNETCPKATGIVSCAGKHRGYDVRSRLRSSPPTSEVSFLCPASAARARHPARAACSSSRAASTSAAWPSGLTFGQARAIRPSGVDEERRPRGAPVGLAVVLLLDPRAVGLGGLVVDVGEEGERQVELLAERPLARPGLRD